MSLKKWGFIFWSTLGLGTVTGLLIGAMLKLLIPGFAFEGFPVGAYEWIFMLLGASLLASVSHVGLFAYLVLRFFAMGMFRSKFLWDILQAVLIAITCFDLFYLRYSSFAADGETWLSYVWMPLAIFAVALAVSYYKVRMTSKAAWIPTMFFMYVVTVLEGIVALRENEMTLIFFTFGTLLVCNAWQILKLHQVLEQPK